MGVDSMNDAGRIGFVIKGNYSATETYDFLDVVYYNGSSYVAKKLTTGNTPQASDDYWQVLANANSADISDETPIFTESTTRTNINSGEKISTLFGKIKKWFTDLKAVAFCSSLFLASSRLRHRFVLAISRGSFGVRSGFNTEYSTI